MKKLFGCLLLLFGLTACSDTIFTDYMNHNKSPNIVTNGGENDDEDFEQEDETVGNIKISANFKNILPNGQIDSNYVGNLQDITNKLPQTTISTNNFENYLYEIKEIDNNNTPNSWFVPNTSKQWSIGDASRNETSYSGADFKSKGQSTTKVQYLRYIQKSPFFGSTSSYNTLMYEKSNGETETLLNRFMFFRWTGMGGGVVSLDNYMLALDTYTGIIFAYAKITNWQDVFGELVPKNYAPIEIYPAADGKKYKFYEYDPSGYVRSDGKIVLHDWFIQDSMQGLQIQLETPFRMNGKSPYYNDGNDVIDAFTENSGGSPITGTLNVQARYLKNSNIHGTVKVAIFKQNDAKFTYAIGANAYGGEDSAAPEVTILASATGETLKYPTQKNFTVPSKSFSFKSDVRDLTLELDSDIFRSNGVGLLVSLFRKDGGIPLTLKYDRAIKKWKGANDFTLGTDEQKDYLITYSTIDGKMELVYTLSWESTYSTTDKGNVVVPQFMHTNTSDTQLVLSGSDNEYLLEYTDTTFESAEQEKSINIELLFNNMLSEGGLITLRRSISSSSTFLQNFKLDNASLALRGAGSGSAAIPVTFILGANPWFEQNEDIIILVTYPTTGYDTTFSPKELKITVKRKMVEEVN